MQVGRIHPALQMTVAEAKLTFPPGLRLQGVSFHHGGERLLVAEKAAVVPRLKSLLGDRKVYAFRIKTHEGAVTGKAEIDGRVPVAVDAVAAGMRLDRIPLVQRLSDRRIEGILNAKMVYAAGEGQPQALNLDLDIQNMAVVLAAPFFTLDQVRFDAVRVEAVLRDRRLDITRIELSGDQIAGSLSGSAALHADIMQSTVALSGTVMPQRQFLASSGMKTAGPLLAGFKAGGGIPITISGPLGDLRLNTR
jgi:type II secretion system protein N